MNRVLLMSFLLVLRSSVRSFIRVPTVRLATYTTMPRYPSTRSMSTIPVLVDTKSTMQTCTADVASVEKEEIPNLKNWKRQKVRQHVNPLARQHQEPMKLDQDWMDTEFSNIGNGEFIVDIGCAKGIWAIDMCKRDPSINVLGLEIRIPIVQQCLQRKQEENMGNVHFMKSNANVDLGNILNSISAKNVTVNTVTIQFPDPHFKSRYKKRRVVNSSLVHTLGKHMQPGTRVFVQTDIEELGYDMVGYFLASEYFTPAEDYAASSLHTNPPIYEVQTEREICTLGDNKPVYRMLFYRNNVNIAG